MANEEKNVEENTNPAPEDGQDKGQEEGKGEDKVSEDHGLLGSSDQPDEESSDGAGDDKPVEYELSVPEDVKVDPGHVDEIASFAREQGLSKEAAQAILDRDAKFIALAKKSQEEQLADTRKEWRKEIAEDKEYGGDKLEATLKMAKRALKRFAPEGFAENLGIYEDHAGLIKLLANVERAMGDDKIVVGGASPTPKAKTRAQTMYPSMPNP